MKEDMFFLHCAILCSSFIWVGTRGDNHQIKLALSRFLLETHTHSLWLSLLSLIQAFYLFLAENQGEARCQQPLLQPSVHSWTHCSSRPWSRFHFCLYLIGYTPPQPVHIINLSAGSTWVRLCCPISYWTKTFSQLHPTRERHFNFKDHPWPALLFALQVHAAINLLVNNPIIY